MLQKAMDLRQIKTHCDIDINSNNRFKMVSTH